MDKVTQLQEQLGLISRLFYNSIGKLQRDAPPVQYSSFFAPPSSTTTPGTAATPSTDSQQRAQGQGLISATGFGEAEIRQMAREMAREIIIATKDLDAMIDQLPGVDISQDEQMKMLEDLEKQDREEGRILLENVERAEEWVETVREALKDFSQAD